MTEWMTLPLGAKVRVKFNDVGLARWKAKYEALAARYPDEKWPMSPPMAEDGYHHTDMLRLMNFVAPLGLTGIWVLAGEIEAAASDMTPVAPPPHPEGPVMTDGTPPKVEPPDLSGMIRRALARQSGPGAAPVTRAAPADMRRYPLGAGRPELVARVPLGAPWLEVLGVEPAFPGLDVQMRDIQRRVIHASVMNDEMDCMRRVLAYLIKEAGGYVAIPLSVFPGQSPEDPGSPELTASNNGRGVVHIAVVPRPGAPTAREEPKP